MLAAAEELAESVKVDDPEPGAEMLVGLKLAVTPAGKPLADSATAASNPSKTAVVMVAVPELPAGTVSDDGFASTEKFALLPDHGVPPLKSLVKVVSIDAMIAALDMISPSSRFSVNEALEKFSEPTNTWASGLP